MKLVIRRANGTDITLDAVDNKLKLELDPDGRIKLDDDDGFRLELTRVEGVTTAFHRVVSPARSTPADPAGSAGTSASKWPPLPPARPAGTGIPTASGTPGSGQGSGIP